MKRIARYPIEHKLETCVNLPANSRLIGIVADAFGDPALLVEEALPRDLTNIQWIRIVREGVEYENHWEHIGTFGPYHVLKGKSYAQPVKVSWRQNLPS